MDPRLIALVVFPILFVVAIGAVILLRPVSRRLGDFLYEWLAIRRAEQEGSGERSQELAARLAALEEGQYRLMEHQEFMESLREKEEPETISSRD